MATTRMRTALAGTLALALVPVALFLWAVSQGGLTALRGGTGGW